MTGLGLNLENGMSKLGLGSTESPLIGTHQDFRATKPARSISFMAQKQEIQLGLSLGLGLVLVFANPTVSLCPSLYHSSKVLYAEYSTDFSPFTRT